MKNLKVETSRVYLRSFRITDLKDLNYYSKNYLVSHYGGYSIHNNLFDSAIQLNYFIKSKDVYAIVDKSTKKVIGSISIRLPEAYYSATEGSYVLGFTLSPDYWRQGIMYELVSTVEFELKKMNVSRIYVGHFNYNEASEKLIKKLDYKYYMTDDVYIHSKNDFVEVLFYYKEL